MYSINAMKQAVIFKIMDYVQLKKLQNSYRNFECPYCRTKYRSERELTASVSSESYIFTCSRCNKSGNIIDLYRILERNLPEEQIIIRLAEQLKICEQLSKTHTISVKTISKHDDIHMGDKNEKQK